MIKVISYLQTVPGAHANYNRKTEKDMILKNFVEGVQRQGDISQLHYGKQIIASSDVGVIQGWVHDRIDTPHLRMRKILIDYYINNNKKLITADANLFLFANRLNPHHYLRYSFNGIFPNTGIYCDDNPHPYRWEQIQRDLNITIGARKTSGSKILFCLQRNGGWSMDGKDVIDWTVDTINEIRKYSDRIIRLRAHPGDKRASEYLNAANLKFQGIKNIEFSEPGIPIEQDLKDTWAVVNHNSSSIVGPIIYGYPAFITDPDRSQCAEVSHKSFEYIETPQEFDREKWLHRISMFHWKFEELKNGKCWAHMRRYV